jgi:hypothetical protein
MAHIHLLHLSSYLETHLIISPCDGLCCPAGQQERENLRPLHCAQEVWPSDCCTVYARGGEVAVSHRGRAEGVRIASFEVGGAEGWQDGSLQQAL